MCDTDLHNEYVEMDTEEIIDSFKNVNGISVDTKIKEIYSCNVLRIEVGTTGHQGGDTGHGGRTYFSLQDLGSTDMKVRIKGDEKDHTNKVEIEFGGDCELETLIEAMEFALKELKSKDNY